MAKEKSLKPHKPKTINGLSIEYNGTTYDKITYLGRDIEGIWFDFVDDHGNNGNIRCSQSDAKINN